MNSEEYNYNIPVIEGYEDFLEKQEIENSIEKALYYFENGLGFKLTKDNNLDEGKLLFNALLVFNNEAIGVPNKLEDKIKSIDERIWFDKIEIYDIQTIKSIFKEIRNLKLEDISKENSLYK